MDFRHLVVHRGRTVFRLSPVAVRGLAPAVIILGASWLRRSRAAVATCVFLVGSTGLGYFLAAFWIAPIFAGGVSYDTTPWTETVVAASTAAAGIAMILAARVSAHRRAPRAA